MTQEGPGIRRIVSGIECIECPQCGTDYNRKLVEAELKKQSPFIFDCYIWTTKFVCQVCRTNIIISGGCSSRSDAEGGYIRKVAQSTGASWQSLTDNELIDNARDLGIPSCESLSRMELIEQIQKHFGYRKDKTGRKWWQFWKTTR